MKQVLPKLERPLRPKGTSCIFWTTRAFTAGGWLPASARTRDDRIICCESCTMHGVLAGAPQLHAACYTNQEQPCC
jgi:hypothetical protein